LMLSSAALVTAARSVQMNMRGVSRITTALLLRFAFLHFLSHVRPRNPDLVRKHSVIYTYGLS
jgi:hypothetical protein